MNVGVDGCLQLKFSAIWLTAPIVVVIDDGDFMTEQRKNFRQDLILVNDLGKVIDFVNEQNFHAARIPTRATAVALKPDYLDAATNLGILLAKQGKIDGAIEQFPEVLRLNPGNDAVRRALETQGKDRSDQ